VKVVVLLKQVMRVRETIARSGEAAWIDEAEAKRETNPYDLVALEAALRLFEGGGDGEVVVVTLGPAAAREALRAALEIGAHRAVHVDDAGVEQADPLAVARLLAAVCRREHPDLVLAGFLSEDRGAAAVGPMVAELLAMPSASGIVSIEPIDSGFRVERELENAAFETVELDAPCLATVQTGLAEVRYPSLKGIVAARKKRIDEIDAAGLDERGAAPRVRMRSLGLPGGGGGTMLEGPVDELVAAVVDKLVELRVV
jgi:electron transfer flavoprotein beta subunit